MLESPEETNKIIKLMQSLLDGMKTKGRATNIDFKYSEFYVQLQEYQKKVENIYKQFKDARLKDKCELFLIIKEKCNVF